MWNIAVMRCVSVQTQRYGLTTQTARFCRKTRYVLPMGYQDGQAFDIDLSCHDTIIRNNYSHDNEGGFLLMMNSTWNNEIYGNISENDCNGLIWYHENNGGTHIHDNLFYIGMEETQVFRGPYGSHDWEITNNIFYCRKPGTEIFWNKTPIYRGNNYYNIATLPNDPDARSEQPDFVPSR